MQSTSKSHQLEAEFTARCEELRSGIKAAKLSSLPDVRAQLEAVRELFTQGTEWWTKYDVRRNSEKLLSLEKDVDVVTRRLKPRRKFRFSQALPSETCGPQLHPTPVSEKAALSLGALGNGIIVDSSSVRNEK
ncbi:hypothetical protein FGB62_11g25 [Gracilaria domingensis]|nr:hypothetical protein FGB62_11g25 [Gracilaria domingensis]